MCVNGNLGIGAVNIFRLEITAAQRRFGSRDGFKVKSGTGSRGRRVCGESKMEKRSKILTCLEGFKKKERPFPTGKLDR